MVTQKEKGKFQYKRNIYCLIFASPIFFPLNITLVTHGPLFFFRLLSYSLLFDVGHEKSLAHQHIKQMVRDFSPPSPLNRVGEGHDQLLDAKLIFGHLELSRGGVASSPSRGQITHVSAFFLHSMYMYMLNQNFFLYFMNT